MTGRVIPLRRVEGRVEELSDEALVAACAIGDHAALVALFDRHHLRLFRFLTRIAGAGAADTEDLLQETFSALWTSAPRYKGDAPALTWLFGIAANVARNFSRTKLRRTRAMNLLGEQPRSQVEPVDETAARREAIRRLQAALTELPHDHRVALVMCDLEGASGNDAARALGVRPGTIWRWLHEARKTLKQAIEGGER